MKLRVQNPSETLELSISEFDECDDGTVVYAIHSDVDGMHYAESARLTDVVELARLAYTTVLWDSVEKVSRIT